MAASVISVMTLCVSVETLHVDVRLYAEKTRSWKQDAVRRGDPSCEAGEDVCAFPGHCGISRSCSASTDGSHSEGDREELRLVLVGSAGAGKSATGNSILRSTVFESRPSAVPVTRECRRGEGAWDGRPLLVVDTPGFLSLRVPEEELAAEMGRCAQLSSPGPHALLLVLQAGRFTAEEGESVQRIQHLFGKDALEFMVIVFTRKDDLESVTIETFVRESEEKLKGLVRSCGGRVCAFNNRATGAERDQQVRELMQLIHKKVAENCRLEKDQDSRGQDHVAQGICRKLMSAICLQLREVC
ncbi:GTPase IMAP family member 2-like [Lissotriton helveticus]